MRIRSIRAVLFAFAVLMLTSASFGQVRISVRFGPPALPVYEQPLCPGEGYIWTPGYWAWSDDDGDYYWVPGTWVLAPEVGYLWTPPFWGWEGGAFIFHEGYWGPHVGFYGGINYGFGYFGDGFAGGRWDHDHFYYNRSVTNVNVTNIHNVYNETVVNNTTVVNRVSYNGGEGGIARRPTPQEENAQRERHIPPPATQVQHMQAARGNRELRASANHGKPPVAATGRPGEFSRAVPAREAGGAYNPPVNRGGHERTAQPSGGNGGNPPTRIVHPNDIPQTERPAYTRSGSEKQDKKHQQQQEKLQQQQEKDRQKLQQRQEQEHQRMTQQKANDARQQQIEQKHQQQTEQLQQRHQQQQQKLQQRQAPPPSRPQAEKPKKQ